MDKFAVDLLLNLKSTVIPKMINIIILDWDDTLFPTEYFKTRIDMLHNHALIPQEINLKLRTIASNIIKIITIVKTYGNISIISNASKEWLQLCFDVIPEIIPNLRTIDIISAQDNFKKLSNNPAKWKEWTFYHHIVNTINIYNYSLVETKHNCYNILSIGDSIHERNALKINTTHLRKHNPNYILSKTIKLVEKPTFESIIKQLDILFHILSKIENINSLYDEDYNLF